MVVAAVATDKEVVDAATLNHTDGDGIGGVVDGDVVRRWDRVDVNGDGIDIDLPLGGITHRSPCEGGVLGVVEVMSG